MGRRAIVLRADFDGKTLRRLARRTQEAGQARRLLALAAVYDGASRGEAAKIGDVSLQTVRDWVLRFNGEGPDGLIDGKAPGHPTKLNDAQRRALKDLVEAGPIPSVHGVVRWRLCDLAQWLNEEYGVSLSEQTMSREMRAMGFRKLSARKRHYAQDERTLDAFKKTSAPRWRKSGRSSLPA
jgi:transposase